MFLEFSIEVGRVSVEWWQVIVGVVTAVILLATALVFVVSNRTAKEALRVQERVADATISSEIQKMSAELHPTPTRWWGSRRELRLSVNNRGPHDAFDVQLTLHRDGATGRLDSQHRIAAKGDAVFEGTVGPDLLPDEPVDFEIELRATYRDGHGEQTAYWRAFLPATERLMDRRWTFEKLDGPLSE